MIGSILLCLPPPTAIRRFRVRSTRASTSLWRPETLRSGQLCPMVPERRGTGGNPIDTEDAMAKQSAQKTKTENGAPTNEAAAPESLDQVRDILFGGQMRMVDSRLRGLEERLFQEQVALRNDFQRKLSDLEVSIKKEFSAHADRLKDERTKRADDLKALASDFNEARKQLDRRQQQLEEAAGLADAELRDQLIKQGAALSADLSRTAQKLSTELDRSATALRAEKLDTSAFATALTDLAARLTGNAKPPGKGQRT
jgi:hypothetical protein